MGIIPSIKVKNGGFAGTVEMEPAGQECWNHDTDTPVFCLKRMVRKYKYVLKNLMHGR